MIISLKQKPMSAVIGIMAFFACVLMLLCLPSVSYAAPFTEENPHIYFTYEQNGVAADPDNLSANETYDVKIWLQGMETISAFQITATIDESVTYSSAPISLMSDNVADVTSMGYVLREGNLVFGFTSDNAENSAINFDGTMVAELSMTFAQAGDAATYITVSENPNLTFAQANYSDGNDNEYAIVTAFEGYTGVLCEMTCDVSPAVVPAGFTLNGSIMIATDITGTASTFGIEGITVSVVDSEGLTIASDITAENGAYTLAPVPAGEYRLIISGPTTIDREVTLVVTESKTLDPVGIVICDYNNKDGYIDSTDLGIYLSYHNGSVYDPNYDYNADGYIDGTDLGVYLTFHGKTIIYNNVILD